MTLAALKRIMRQFVAERGWQKYHTPRNLAASVAVEAGELLELFQWLTPQQATRKSCNDVVFRRAVADEIADVVMYAVSLANAMELDLARSITDKMARNRSKYPREQFFGRYERPIIRT